jgi:hypothetical protein
LGFFYIKKKRIEEKVKKKIETGVSNIVYLGPEANVTIHVDKYNRLVM